MRNLKRFTVSLLTVATLITAFPFTAKAEDGEPVGEGLVMKQMSDKEFVESVIMQRMELCYSRWKDGKSSDKKDDYDEIEYYLSFLDKIG